MNRFFTILAVLLFSVTVSAQVSIGGEVNSYYSVSAINTNSVICFGEDVSDLSPGDKVMLIQMTGGNFWSYDPTDKDGLALTDGTLNIGNYELLSVLSANNGTKEIEFTANLSKSYDAGEKIQLVKIYEANDIVVESEVTATAWDGNKGGVVAIVALGKLTLNANIDVSGKGYRGGNILQYSGACLPAAIEDTMYFDDGTVNRGGEKGEGGMILSFGQSIGPGKHYLGGGGGVGRFGGGAGGSNYRAGGNGGFQIDGCSQIKKAKGGASLEDAINNHNQIFFGGGGGTSAQDGIFLDTKGGNGGGIVLLLCDTLVGNGNNVNAAGQAVDGTASANGGGGGGGAGGTVLLDIETISGTVNFDLTGGKGGDVDGNCAGAGGGGAGGVLFHNKSSLPASLIPSLSGGAVGEIGVCANSDASSGGDGEHLPNLELVLNGFTFNAVTGSDIICEGQQPNGLMGTIPKGDSPVYQWYESDDSITWNPIGGADAKDYQPPVLVQTTWYTRDVTLDGITDRAIPAKIFVYDAISNNDLTLRDTLCSGAAPGILTANTPIGGDATYSYQWQSSLDLVSWTDRGDENTAQLNETNPLTQDTYYRRIVTSAMVCSDISAVDTLTILEAITNNNFINLLDTTICEGLDAGTIYGEQPGGGKLGDYRYQWQQSTDSIVFSDIGGAEAIHYAPGVLTNTYYYKRIVLSGSGNECVDTSEHKAIDVIGSITDNNIVGDAIQYTCDSTSKELVGTEPAGGNNQFVFNWQSSDDELLWTDEENGDENNFESNELVDPTYFRRIVSLGDNSKCVDTSTAVLVELYPLPTGDIVTALDTVCAGSSLDIEYLNLTGAVPWTITLGETSELIQQTGITDLSGSITAENLEETADIKILELEDANGCFADISLMTGIHRVVVYRVPTSIAGEDFNECGLEFSMNAQLSITDQESVGLWTYSDNVDVFDDPTNPTTGVTMPMDSYGEEHTFTWTETNWECVGVEDVVLVNLFEEPVSANAGMDQELSYTFETTLDADPYTISDSSGGVWRFLEGTGDITDINDAKSFVDLGDGNVGSYLLEWKIGNSSVCDSVSDELSIIIKDLQLSNGFSPNGDGINEYFNITVPSGNEVILTILDRNGSKVRTISSTESDAEGVSWDGTNESGQQVPADTYYYIMEEDGGKTRNGFIEIRR